MAKQKERSLEAKKITALQIQLKTARSQIEEIKEFRSVKKENEILIGHVNQLKERLIATIEILENVLPYPRRISNQIDRLTAKDYSDYCSIVKYMIEHNKEKITSHILSRLILPGKNYKDLELTLLNLHRQGLIELFVGKQYLEICLVGSSFFKKIKQLEKINE